MLPGYCQSRHFDEAAYAVYHDLHVYLYAAAVQGPRAPQEGGGEGGNRQAAECLGAEWLGCKRAPCLGVRSMRKEQISPPAYIVCLLLLYGKPPSRTSRTVELVDTVTMAFHGVHDARLAQALCTCMRALISLATCPPRTYALMKQCL